MVADGRGGVTQRVVCGDHRLPLVEVGLQGALEHVAGVEEQHGAAVTRARGAQVADVAAEQRQATPIAALQDAAVQIVRADDGEGDGGASR